MDISVLRAQHDALSGIAVELLQQVNGSEKPRPVGALRWKLARALIAHLAVEDGYFYPDMLSAADAEARRVALDFQCEMGDLAGRFTDYMARWTDERIVREWGLFRQETRAMMETLAARIMRENERLYPLAPARWQQQGTQQMRKAG
ncbi:hemerythrin domain-containing protein [Sphingobium aquiterrae]|uniref:hemerythrin domain-containing protein n=1 Tax=Sphingobium aquiterrae TaxID=2038656 RepID=UPI00301B082C